MYLAKQGIKKSFLVNELCLRTILDNFQTPQKDYFTNKF